MYNNSVKEMHSHLGMVPLQAGNTFIPMGGKYPKILSYPPSSVVDNTYHFVNKDIEVISCSRIELRLTLPEIKGIGQVQYNRNYPFLLVKNFETIITNPGGEPMVYESIDGEGLYSRHISQNRTLYNNMFGGKNDLFCETKKGSYPDCVIFPSREIVIPLSITKKYCFLYPETKIEFRIELYELNELISYDTVFMKSTLETAKDLYKTSAKNIKLFFTNIIDSPPIDRYPLSRVIKTVGEDGMTTLVSKPFKHARHIRFGNKTSIFNSENIKFPISFGPSMEEKDLIKKWNKKILDDLIVVTHLDLRTKNGKEALGFSEEANFVRVENDKIKFEDHECVVSINNIPSDAEVYYHTNILTFSRRHEKHNILNISKMFSYIRGIYFDSGPIYFLMDELKHNIEIKHICIPTNIWCHEYNTTTKDQRSIESKKTDFYFKNRFIQGMDILGKDKGFQNVSIGLGRDCLTNAYLATCGYTSDSVCDGIYMIEEEHQYPTQLEFTPFHFRYNQLIAANPKINFESFTANISWTNYDDYNPISLFKRIPILYIAHHYNVVNNDTLKTISIEEY